jgi:FtsZ-binding cell division protein ZapB
LVILQQEQDHAVSLLSLSPLLSSLFISYATRAAALGSTPTTPPSETDEWKSLQDTITVLQEENEKLKSETREMAARLEAAEVSQEELRSQVLPLKEANTTQQEDIRSLRVQASEAEHKYNRLVEDSNAEKVALKVQISDLQVCLQSRLSSPELDAVIDTHVAWVEPTGTPEGDRC